MNQQIPTYTPDTHIETQEQKERRTQICTVLLLPSILYAVAYVFLLHKNYNSITMPFFVLATLSYSYYCTKKLHRVSIKKGILYAIGMLLLGTSTCLTGSLPLQIFNFFGIIILIICMLLDQYCNVQNWTMVKYVCAMFMMMGGAISCIEDFFHDVICFAKMRKTKQSRKIGYILLGTIIAIPFLAVIIVLFYSADIVFADIVRNSFDFDLDIGNIFLILLTFLFILFASYCGMRFLNKKKISEASPDLRRLEPILANTFLSLIGIVYLLFSGIQIFYLFLGNLTLPDGYTYAEYAREGFFQLLFVSMLNIGIVLFFLGLFRENKLLKVLLTIISLCTYVMIASSALRMCMYIREYELTFLRVFVLWFLALLAILLAGVLIVTYKRTFPLFRYMLLTVSICYIAFSFAHPDYWIAKYNLSHATESESRVSDDDYLQYLSSDAAPIIVNCNEPWVENYKEFISENYDDSLRKFNVSRWYANRVFKKR